MSNDSELESQDPTTAPTKDAAPHPRPRPTPPAPRPDASAMPSSEGPSRSPEGPSLSKAQKLEAKAARLREAEVVRARKAYATPPTAHPAPPWMIATGVLAFLLALVLGLGIPYALDKRSAVDHNAQVNSARKQVLAIAKKFAVAAASFDYRHVDADFRATEAYMTPDFKKNFEQVASRLAPLVVQAKAISTATVGGYGVTTVSTKHAVVLVFLDQTIKQATSASNADLAHNRAIVTLDKEKSGTWLVSDLTLQ